MDKAERREYMRKYRLAKEPKEITAKQKASKKAYNASPKARAYRVFKKQIVTALACGLIVEKPCQRCISEGVIKKGYAVQHATKDIRYTSWLCILHKKQWETPTGDIFDELEY